MEIITGLFSLIIIFSVISISSAFFLALMWMYAIYFLFIIGIFVLWIIAIIDCVKRDDKDFTVGGDNAKLIWILLLIFVHVSCIPYYIIIMKKKLNLNK